MKDRKKWKTYGRAIIGVCGLLCLMALYVIALQYTKKLETCRERAVFILEESPLTSAQVLEISRREEEQEAPREFAAWQQENEVTVYNPELNRSCAVSVVAVCGRSDLVLRASTWIDQEDTDGCLIDEATARALFGSTQVNGMTVEVQGSAKRIRGILYGVSDTVLYQADETQTLKKLTVSMRAKEGYAGIRQDFMMRYALTGKFLRMDILYRLAKILCLLIPLFAVSPLLGELGRSAWRGRNGSEGFRCALLLAAGLTFLLWFLAGNIEIPKDMIPTKWSDFDFWSDWWQSEKESLLLLLLSEKQKPQQRYLADFYPVLLCCLLAFCMRRLVRGLAEKIFML